MFYAERWYHSHPPLQYPQTIDNIFNSIINLLFIAYLWQQEDESIYGTLLSSTEINFWGDDCYTSFFYENQQNVTTSKVSWLMRKFG